MKLNYNTLTTKDLEEKVEFIDWSLIPSHLITEGVKTKFGSIPQLQARIWFEDLILKMERRKNKYVPGNTYFYIGDDLYMNILSKYYTVYCSTDKIWSILIRKYLFTDIEAQLFIRNMVNKHFNIKGLEIRPNTNFF